MAPPGSVSSSASGVFCTTVSSSSSRWNSDLPLLAQHRAELVVRGDQVVEFVVASGARG